MKVKNKGIELKKGQIVRLLADNSREYVGRVFEVEADNTWDKKRKCWSGVKLKFLTCPRLTHKNNMELVTPS